MVFFVNHALLDSFWLEDATAPVQMYIFISLHLSFAEFLMMLVARGMEGGVNCRKG